MSESIADRSRLRIGRLLKMRLQRILLTGRSSVLRLEPTLGRYVRLDDGFLRGDALSEPLALPYALPIRFAVYCPASTVYCLCCYEALKRAQCKSQNWHMLFQYWMMVIALCFSGGLLSGQPVLDNREQVDLTARAIRHIQERHWPDSPAPGAGKYAPGITVDALREMIQRAVANGHADKILTDGRAKFMNTILGVRLGHESTADQRPGFESSLVHATRWLLRFLFSNSEGYAPRL